MGRDMKDIFIIDNSPTCYMFQPENGMPILSWYDDKHDSKLLELIPVLQKMAVVDDVRPVLVECSTRDNRFMCEKAYKMCEKIIVA